MIQKKTVFTAHTANLQHAVLLFLFAMADYFLRANSSSAALTPVLFSVVLLALSNGIYYGVRSQIRAALAVTCMALVYEAVRGFSIKAGSFQILNAVLLVSGTLAAFFLATRLKK